MTETAQAIEAVQAVPVQADQVDPIAAVAEPVPTDQPTRAVVRGAPVVVAREVVVQRAPTGIGFGSCIRGIDVRLHWSLFLVTVLTMLLAWYWEEGLMRILLHFVVYGPVLYLTVLLHELGHAFTTMRLGGEVTHLVLWPAGGLTITGPVDGSARDDLKIALAGPLTHIPMMLFWFVVLWLCWHANGGENIALDDLGSPSTYLGNLAYTAFSLNAYIMLPNLCLPIYPFDSGRIIGSALILSGMKVPGAAKVTGLFGVAIGVTISILGLVWFGFYDGLPELLIGVLVLFSSATLFSNAKNGTLSDDIIFGRPCYSVSNNVRRDDGSVGSVPESTPPSAIINELVVPFMRFVLTFLKELCLVLFLIEQAQ